MIALDQRRCEDCGCSQCKAVGTIRVCCDEPGCFGFGTIGTPGTDVGPYRVTCWKHSRWAKERKGGGE